MAEGNFLDSLIVSGRDAFSFKNLLLRVLYFVFFGFILSLRTLVRALDTASQNGGGLFKYFQALSSATYHGVGVSLASIWSLLVNWNEYLQSSSYGSIVIGIVMGFVIIGFFYQPISLIVNIFDGKGKQETGNASGQATGALVRLGFTLFIVMILSASCYYTGVEDPILSDVDEISIDINETIPDTNVTVNITTDDNLINSINMLTG